MRKSIGLAAVLVGFAVTGCSGGGDAPKLPASNVSKFEFQVSKGLYYFQTPDRSIKCGIFTRGFPVGVGCQTYLAPVPDSLKDCAPLGGTRSVGVQIIDKKAKQYCLAQGLWVGPAVEGMDVGGGQILQDGQVLDVDGAVCESKGNAITCTKDGAGFTMSATENKVY